MSYNVVNINKDAYHQGKPVMIKNYILLSTLVAGFANADVPNWSFKTDVKFESSEKFMSVTVPINGGLTTFSYLQDGKEVKRGISVELLDASDKTIDLEVKVQDGAGNLMSSTQFLNAAICQENQAKHDKYEMRFIPFNTDACKQYFDVEPKKFESSNINSVSLHIPETKTKSDWNIINFSYSKSAKLKDKPSLIQIRPLCGQTKELCHYHSSGSPSYLQNEGMGFSKFRIRESETLTGLTYSISTDKKDAYKESGVIELEPITFNQ